MIRQLVANDLIGLVLAVRWTLILAVMAFTGGALIGLTIALMRTIPFWPTRILAAGYIQVVQGVPLLVWLFMLYFGIALLGWNVSAWVAAAAGLSVYAAAFLGEIWFGALRSVTKTQWEAGASLGLSLAQQLRYIVIPQSIRIAIPPTVGFLVQLTKNTSLASTIGFTELTRAGQLTSAATYRPFAVYLIVSAIYFALCFPLTQWSRYLERKIHGAR